MTDSPIVYKRLAPVQVAFIKTCIDHASGPLGPQETLRLLMGQNGIHIAGNHDHNLVKMPTDEMGPSDRYAYEHIGLAEKPWLQELPALVPLELDGQAILLCHGAPCDGNQYLLETVESGLRTGFIQNTSLEEGPGKSHLL